uniref:Uncharacterized protein n=1 Tax=Anopheles dirus TaxID=7168 RepID=A0A182NYP5_9DIPT
MSIAHVTRPTLPVNKLIELSGVTSPVELLKVLRSSMLLCSFFPPED